MDIKYEIIKSNRKTFAVTVKNDLRVIVRAPLRATRAEIEKIVQKNENWIINAIQKTKDKNESVSDVSVLTEQQTAQLVSDAKAFLNVRVKYFADLMNLKYNHISVKKQKTRYGSCSTKGNLNFNCVIMLMPDTVQDYVIVHELCHLIEMNHSKRFWAQVEKILPDYKQSKVWLKQNGGVLLKRIDK